VLVNISLRVKQQYMNWPVQFTARVKKAWNFTSNDTTSVRAAWAWRWPEL
jgi:hypothetical protein